MSLIFIDNIQININIPFFLIRMGINVDNNRKNNTNKNKIYKHIYRYIWIVTMVIHGI